MKKSAVRVVLIIVGVVLLMLILTYGTLFIRDLKFHPYENDSWQTIDFFDKGSIQAPSDWTYTSSENAITLFGADGEAIICISADDDYSAPGFAAEKDSKFIERRNNLMGTGMYHASSKIEIYSDMSTGENYYYAEIFKRDIFSSAKAPRSFGYFFAKAKDISIEEFTNIVTSYKK